MPTSTTNPVDVHNRHLPLLLFGLGTALALALIVHPAARQALERFSQAGPVAQVVNGALYTSGLTTPLATILIAESAQDVQPLQLAVLGALGALAYDSVLFRFIRRSVHRPFFQRLRERFFDKPAISWALAVLGALIIASPIPDELGIGLLGLSHIRRVYFLPISFVLNGLGIYIIARIAHG